MQGTSALEWAVLVCTGARGNTVLVMEESKHAKALTALADGQLQHLVQLLVGVIGREAQLVKTRQRRAANSQVKHLSNIYRYSP